jgi:predicted anti-sigma-YlaC factor YlaD
MNCQEIERIVWMEGPDAAPHDHLEDCRSCREEVRRAADLQAALSGMRNRFAVPPASLEPELIAALTRSRLDRARGVVQHPRFWRGAAVGAAAAAAAATAAVGIIVARRRAIAPDLVA